MKLKTTLTLLLLLMLLPTAIAETQIISAAITTTTNNGTVTTSIQGGNSYTLNCLTDQTIIQNLTTAKEISTTTQGTCQDKFSIFVDSYADFVKTYNSSIQEEFKNCIDAKASNTRNYEVIQTLNTSLTNCIETKATNETIFYNEWKACNDKPEKDCSTEITTITNSLNKERESLKNEKWTYGFLGAILGAAVVYFMNKRQTGETPAYKMPRF